VIAPSLAVRLPLAFPLVAAVVAALVPAARSWADDGLTDNERAWVAAAMPVVRHGRALQLPLDIVVQPDAQPDASPIALGIRDGRCKLVLSLRGNPAADDLQAGVPHDRFDAVAQAVFAHEMAHCWRWSQGAWHALPAGFVDAPEDSAPVTADAATLAALALEMRETRREEAYADLVGLAWTARTHPADYAAVREWMGRFRDDALPGDHHDTTPWLRLADDPGPFAGDADIFRAAGRIWERGLHLDAEVRTAQPPNGGGPSASMR
jgi:hypothetical protein